MNLLAVDFGTKRMGLAWTDTTLGVVLPFGVVYGKNLAEISQKLLRIIAEEKPDKIIFGLPKELSGQESVNTARVKKFAEEIAKLSGTKIDFFDERLSSRLADNLAGESTRDEKAAAAVLADYIKQL